MSHLTCIFAAGLACHHCLTILNYSKSGAMQIAKFDNTREGKNGIVNPEPLHAFMK